MNNYVQPGQVLRLTNPGAALASGQACMIGDIFGIACDAIGAGAVGDFATEGVFNIAKTAVDIWAVGDRIYYNAGTGLVDNDPTVGQFVGVATAVTVNPSATGSVKLCGVAEFNEGTQAAEADLTDNSGGAAADGTIAAIAATPGACAGGAAPTAAQVDTAIATAVASIVSGGNDAVKELATKVNAILAKLRITGQIAT